MKIALETSINLSDKKDVYYREHQTNAFAITASSNNTLALIESYFEELTITVFTPDIAVKISNCIISKLIINSNRSARLTKIEIKNTVFNEITIDSPSELIEIIDANLINELEVPIGEQVAQNGKIQITAHVNSKLTIQSIKLNNLIIQSFGAGSRPTEIILNKIITKEATLINPIKTIIRNSNFDNLKMASLDQQSISEFEIRENTEINNLEVDYCDHLTIIESKIKSQILYKRIAGVLNIKGCEINSIRNKNQSVASLSQLVRLRIESSNLSGKVKRSKVDLLSLNVDETNLEISISQTDLNKLEINNRTINNKLNVNDITLATLQIRNSNLKEAVFNRTTFINQSGSGLIIENSSVELGTFQTVQWTKDYRLNEKESNYSTASKVDYYWNLREGYRQLKVISLNAHNKIDAKRFLKNELRIYLKQLSFLTFRTSVGDFFTNIVDWVILFSNRIFSNFGESVGLPFLWLIGIHSLFMIYAFLPEFGLVFDPLNYDPDSTTKGFEVFLTLLSPLHSIEIKFEWLDKSVNLIGKGDFFMRIASSYFIFYFIRATRKFNFGV